MANTYNGILFSLKKEENLVTCYNMAEPWENHTKRRHGTSLEVQCWHLAFQCRGWGFNTHVPHGQKPKHKTNNIVTNSIDLKKKKEGSHKETNIG